MEAAGEVNRLLEGFLAGVRATADGRREVQMLLPKTMVVEQLRARGDTEGAERADRELGEKVDTEQDADLLASLGVDAAKLADDFGGQVPGGGVMGVALVTAVRAGSAAASPCGCPPTGTTWRSRICLRCGASRTRWPGRSPASRSTSM